MLTVTRLCAALISQPLKPAVPIRTRHMAEFRLYLISKYAQRSGRVAIGNFDRADFRYIEIKSYGLSPCTPYLSCLWDRRPGRVPNRDFQNACCGCLRSFVRRGREMFWQGTSGVLREIFRNFGETDDRAVQKFFSPGHRLQLES